MKKKLTKKVFRDIKARKVENEKLLSSLSFLLLSHERWHIPTVSASGHGKLSGTMFSIPGVQRINTFLYDGKAVMYFSHLAIHEGIMFFCSGFSSKVLDILSAPLRPSGITLLSSTMLLFSSLFFLLLFVYFVKEYKKICDNINKIIQQGWQLIINN